MEGSSLRGPKQSSAVRLAGILLLGLYPIIVYFGIGVLPASFFGLLLAAGIAARLAFVRNDNRALVLPALGILLVYAAVATALAREQALLYYPVILNLILCVVFTISLRKGEPLLLRFVLSRGVVLSEYGPRYLTCLTAVWAGFFAANALIAAWTTTASLETWALYNGFIAYLLIGALLGFERLYRSAFLRRRRAGSK
jgi:uncharacterized membrane protein